MAKSLQDRQKGSSIAPIFSGIAGKFPVLKKGLFKPDLGPLCDNYDKGVNSADALSLRQTNLSKFADQIKAANETLDKAVSSNDSERKKSNEQNYAQGE